MTTTESHFRFAGDHPTSHDDIWIWNPYTSGPNSFAASFLRPFSLFGSNEPPPPPPPPKPKASTPKPEPKPEPELEPEPLPPPTAEEEEEEQPAPQVVAKPKKVKVHLGHRRRWDVATWRPIGPEPGVDTSVVGSGSGSGFGAYLRASPRAHDTSLQASRRRRRVGIHT